MYSLGLRAFVFEACLVSSFYVKLSRLEAGALELLCKTGLRSGRTMTRLPSEKGLHNVLGFRYRMAICQKHRRSTTCP